MLGVIEPQIKHGVSDPDQQADSAPDLLLLRAYQASNDPDLGSYQINVVVFHGIVFPPAALATSSVSTKRSSTK